MKWYKVSSKTGEGVNEMVDDILNVIMQMDFSLHNSKVILESATQESHKILSSYDTQPFSLL